MINPQLQAKTSQILFYTDLICKKIDFQVEAFAKRIWAVRKGDWEKAEFIEKMALKPLDEQIKYLCTKVINIK